MKVEILELARQELEDAIMYYELERSGLGKRFRDEVRQAIKRIKMYPNAWPIERGEIRKCFVHRFPYNVVYAVQGQLLVVLAIAHQHRKPGYWIDRLE